jgi:hypothetical protein
VCHCDLCVCVCVCVCPAAGTGPLAPSKTATSGRRASAAPPSGPSSGLPTPHPLASTRTMSVRGVVQPDAGAAGAAAGAQSVRMREAEMQRAAILQVCERIPPPLHPSLLALSLLRVSRPQSWNVWASPCLLCTESSSLLSYAQRRARNLVHCFECGPHTSRAVLLADPNHPLSTCALSCGSGWPSCVTLWPGTPCLGPWPRRAATWHWRTGDPRLGRASSCHPLKQLPPPSDVMLVSLFWYLALSPTCFLCELFPNRTPALLSWSLGAL